MSDDAFTLLLRRLQAEARANDARAGAPLGAPLQPDQILAPLGAPPEHDTLRQLLARELLRLEREGWIAFGTAVRPQVEEAARVGNWSMRGETRPAPDVTLLTLLALAMRQTAPPSQRRPPCQVMSLFRASGGHSPHDYGLGIDLARYNGYDFQGPTLRAFRGALILVRNLPRGNFEIGLPRVPREDWHDFDRYRHYRVDGEFVFRQDRDYPEFSPRFRRPGPLGTRPPSEAWSGPGEFLQPDLEIRRSPSRRGLAHDLPYFDQPGHAMQFRMAADESEGTVRLVFPDEPNHLHITVDIDGAWSAILPNRPPRRPRRGRR